MNYHAKSNFLEGLTFEVYETLDDEMLKQFERRALVEHIISKQCLFYAQTMKSLFKKTIVRYSPP